MSRARIKPLSHLINTPELHLNLQMINRYAGFEEQPTKIAGMDRLVNGTMYSIENRNMRSMPDLLYSTRSYDMKWLHGGDKCHTGWLELKVWDGQMDDKVKLDHYTAGQKRFLRLCNQFGTKGYLLIRLNGFLLLMPAHYWEELEGAKLRDILTAASRSDKVDVFDEFPDPLDFYRRLIDKEY